MTIKNIAQLLLFFLQSEPFTPLIIVHTLFNLVAHHPLLYLWTPIMLPILSPQSSFDSLLFALDHRTPLDPLSQLQLPLTVTLLSKASDLTV